MKNSIKIAIAFVCLLTIQVCCQAPDSVKNKKLNDLGLFRFPKIHDLDTNIFNDSLLQAVKLSPDNINPDFTNTVDLSWLKDVAAHNKVVLLGEEHYHQVIANFRNRILFYLNTIDYFPLLIMEAQYSSTPFLNYYINVPDDAEAEKFFSNTLYDMVNTEDALTLLHMVRKWNKEHPLKKLTLGFSDIEHDYNTTLKKIIFPYFKELDDKPEPDIKALNLKDIGKILPRYFKLLEKAVQTNHIGEFPFITPKYIGNVLKNLQSTYYSYCFEFNYYRQKAIVRNLVDPAFFGEFFTNGKAVLHGGSYHLTTHFSYPDNANFYREGSYLAEDFPPTKGRVYSISFHSFSRALGNMAEINVDSCLHQGSYYFSLVKQWQKAYKDSLCRADEYLFDFTMNDMHRLLMKRMLQFDNNPMLVKKLDWDSALKTAKQKNESLYNELKNWAEDSDAYDAHVYIPGSVFVTAAKKKPALK